MIHCSSLHKVCTHKPKFDPQYEFSLEELKRKVESKGIIFDINDVENYSKTHGLMVIARDFIAKKNQRIKDIKDDLPKGAKEYLKEVYLEKMGFYSPTKFASNFATRKGIAVEDSAIKLLAEYHGISYSKNTVRKSYEDFLTGECDVLYERNSEELFGVPMIAVRDIKCPEDFLSFRNKHMEIPYHWQLIGYCILFDASFASIDYILMPTPPELLEPIFKNIDDIKNIKKIIASEKLINSLPCNKRVKTFNLHNIEEDILFAKSRIEKSKQYYETLTYEICMGFVSENEENES